MIRRALDRWLGARCPICRDRARYLPVHIRIDHAETSDFGLWLER